MAPKSATYLAAGKNIFTLDLGKTHFSEVDPY